MRPWAIAGLLAALTLTACARRSHPYPFRAPLVAAVRAERLPPRRPPAPPMTTPRAPAPRVAAIAPARQAAPPTSMEVIASRGPADRLRELVGVRERTATDLELALVALDAADLAIPPALRGLEDGAALVERARAHDAFDAGEPPQTGDLIVFDEVVPGRQASLIGVVIAVDDRGVIEFVYLTRGVVRRGFADPARPGQQRDPGGRILNTLVRHLDGAPPRGARFLAGELLAGYVRLERLPGRSGSASVASSDARVVE